MTFYDALGDIVPWTRSQRLAVRASITVPHLLASSAIPFVFPAVALDIDGHIEYCGDGSMRQAAPISPAVHLGAERILVVGAGRMHEPPGERVGSSEYPNLAQIAGHALSNIFLDALAVDVERLQRINATLALLPPRARAETSLKPIEVLVIAPSERLDDIAAQAPGQPAAADPRDAARPRRLGARATTRAAPRWPSYLLFEAPYTRELMALGVRDTMARRNEVRAFFGWSTAPRRIAGRHENGLRDAPERGGEAQQDRARRLTSSLRSRLRRGLRRLRPLRSLLLGALSALTATFCFVAASSSLALSEGRALTAGGLLSRSFGAPSRLGARLATTRFSAAALGTRRTVFGALDGRGGLRRRSSGAAALAVAALAGGGAGAKALPLTVRPPSENLAALLSPTPLTRTTRSFQSLKSPFLRSLTMSVEITGPMPLIASSSAWVALLASTAANAVAASSAASAATNFLNMEGLPPGGVERQPDAGTGSPVSCRRGVHL